MSPSMTTTDREVFVRLSGRDMTPELVSCYDTIARLSSLALQYGAPLDSIEGMLLGTRYERTGGAGDGACAHEIL